jgi:lysophospholipase L1-like esterase
MKRVFWVIPLLVLAVVVVLILRPRTNKTSTPQPVSSGYIALGDSVAAGYGLETASDSSACDRTREAYPTLVAYSLKLELQSYACTGATMAEGILGSQTINNLALPPQLDQALKSNTPKLITITIGANDIGWTNILSKCISSDCGSITDSNDITSKLTILNSNLSVIMERIKSRFSQSEPQVIITGYYNAFPASGESCNAIPGLTATEQAWWDDQASKLNSTISNAVANYSFVKYVPLVFSGHDLCSSASWVQGLNNRGPFHPTDEGEVSITKTITESYKKVKN